MKESYLSVRRVWFSEEKKVVTSGEGCCSKEYLFLFGLVLKGMPLERS